MRNFFIKTIPILLIVSVLPLIFIKIDKENIREQAYTEIDNFFSMKIGISGIPGLYNRSNMTEFDDNFSKIVKTLIKEFPERVLKRLNIIIPNIFKENIYSKENILIFDVKFKNWEKIENERNRALDGNLLIERKKVKFKGLFNGYKIFGKMRLKGDFNDHWRSPKRMSLMIELSNKSNSVLGFKKFAIHKPEARQYPFEQIFQKLAADLDIITVKHDYAEILINGENWGVMNLQETFSKELLEKQKYKESLIIKMGNESIAWNISSKYGSNTGYRGGSEEDFNMSVHKGKKYLNDNSYPQGRYQYSYIKKKLTNKDFNNIINIEKTSKLAILALTWGSTHVLQGSNSRYYLNPYTLRLEPISSDQSSPKLKNAKFYRNIQIPEFYQYALEKVIESGKILQLLNQVEKVLKNIELYKNQESKIFPNDYPKDLNLIIKNFSLIKRIFLQKNRNYNIKKQNKFNSNIQNIDHHVWIKDGKLVNVDHFENGIIKISNNIPNRVTIKKIIYNKKNILKEHVFLSKSNKELSFYTHQSNIFGVNDKKITVISSLGEHSDEVQNKITYLVDDLNNPLDFDNSSLVNSKFIEIKDKNIFIKKGVWEINQPLKIMGNLFISKGTKLRFSKKAYLLVNGSIKITGTENKPVILESLDDYWQGLFLIGNSNKTSLKNIIFKNMNGFKSQLLTLTGCINLYNISDIDIENMKIENTFCEDSINIVKSSFKIKNIKISNSKSDAIDIDFSNGEIVDIDVVNSNNDAIDLSGSNVTLSKININEALDKGISAGENSFIKIEDAIINNVGIGIASKDGSYLEGVNVKINNSKLANGMTYNKKTFYKSSTLKLKKFQTDNKRNLQNFLSQKKSSLYVNGLKYKNISLNTADLYAK